jgi:hypothetical protein
MPGRRQGGRRERRQKKKSRDASENAGRNESKERTEEWECVSTAWGEEVKYTRSDGMGKLKPELRALRQGTL